ncbi:MAG TPA: WYL domain-containing protein [Acidimicrobiales bacterium]|nr:WYL domain-containing protein [Acidimicrobiales bacterium]
MAERDPGLRFRRLLAMVAWLAARKSAKLSEIAEQFNMREEEVERDLMLVSMCGLPPYSPDQLIDVLVVDDVVEARIPDYFHRPRQLTANDALSLLTAGRVLLAVPGADPAGPLGRALEKLSEALGGADGGVAVELDAPLLLDQVRQANDNLEQIELQYYSASKDTVSTRVVDPISVFNESGHWYLEAYCHQATKVLTFRVDRIESVTPTGEASAPPVKRQPRQPVRVAPGAETDTVTITVGPNGRWVTENYPVERVDELKSGRLRITLTVAGDAFLDRLLLRLGPDVVVNRPVAKQDALAQIAQRILARYSDTRGVNRS